MAKVLITVWPFPTHLNPNLAVAEALRQRGHQAVFYSAGPALGLVRSLQFEYHAARLDWPGVQQTVDRLIAERRRPRRTGLLWKEFLVDTIPAQLDDLNPLLDRLRPQAILCDLTMWGPILFLHQQRRLPVALLSHVANCLLPGPEGPIPGAALPQRRSWWRRLQARGLSWAADFFTSGVRAGVDQLRREHGLEPLGCTVTEFTASMPLYMVPGAPELDRNRSDLPACVHYVGPCLREDSSGPAPTWAESLGEERPCVIVDEGSLYAQDSPLPSAAADGLAGLPLDAVILAGQGRDASKLISRSPAPNVRVASGINLSSLLPRAKAVITNGNSESVLAALTAGLPLIVVPSIWDQAETAWRVEETGAGLRIPPRQCRPGRLKDALTEVMENASFRRQACRIGAALSRRGGPVRAAQLVEKLIEPSAERKPCRES